MFRPMMFAFLVWMLTACAAVPASPSAVVTSVPPRFAEPTPFGSPTVIPAPGISTILPEAPDASRPGSVPPTMTIPDASPVAPYAPQPGDDKLHRGNVHIESAGLLMAESYPPQVFLVMSGSLPTPCHQLRVEVSAPDAQNRIQVEAYSLVDPNAICAQVLKAFEASVRLGSYPAGHYTVWLNGRRIGEFDT